MATLVTYLNTDPLGDFRWVTEASALGLAPGQWPETLPTVMGNGQPLVRAGADAGSVTYRQALGVITLVVLND